MTKQRSKLKDSSVSTQVIIKPLVRTINDIGTWRSALSSADRGNRRYLYNLYEDLLIDGTLSDAIDKRIDAVKDADIAFTVNGKEPDEMKDLIDSMPFENLIGEIMLSRFWGVSVDEFSFNNLGFDFVSLPRKHIRTTEHEIAKDESDERGIPYADISNILQFGNDTDLGILLRAAPYVIYKRGGFGDWAQFVELFGMPQRIGKYSSMDEASRKALIEAFETAGSAPYLVIPKETEAEQSQLTSSGNGALYNDFRNACNEEILIAILGQTMTTVDGSSLAQGKVHLAVQEKKHNADKRFVERTLNRLFVPLLEARGYPVRGGKFRFLKQGEETTVAELIQLTDVVDIPASYVYDRYNIPKPIGGEQLAKKQAAPVQVELPDPEPNPNDPEPIDPEPPKIDKKDEKEETKVKNSFWKQFRDFFVGAPSWHGAISSRPIPQTIENPLIRKCVESKGHVYFDAETFWKTSDKLIQAIREGVKKGKNDRIVDIDINYDSNDDAFLVALEQNIYHFSGAKNLAEAQQINEAFRDAKSYKEFEDKALSICNQYDKDWLQTEYQTALLTAESSSNYNRLMKVAQVYTLWEYKTVGDDKVREEHATLDGLVLPNNDPVWDKIFPPNGWNCRCRVAGKIADKNNPVNYSDMRKRVDEFYQSKEWQSSVKNGFGTNRGMADCIYSQDQMYVKDWLKKEPKLIDKIDMEEWKVPSIEESSTESDIIMPQISEDYESWFKKNAIDGILRITDYLGRSWKMEWGAFKIHAEKAKGVRSQYLNAIKDVMVKPDQVWLGQDVNHKKNDLNNFLMVKYYKDNAIVCVGKVVNRELVFKSWFKADPTSEFKGWLIKK